MRPMSWRDIHLLGWIGKFHACSDACEKKIRGRVLRPEKAEDDE